MSHFRTVVAVSIAVVTAWAYTASHPSLAADAQPSNEMAATRPATPQVGDMAGDHALADLDGNVIHFADELKSGPLVVVVLRGWPGYQCPFCTAQFGDLLAHARDFQAAGAQVLAIYPGPADGLREHAKEFQMNRSLPPNFKLLVDPNYTFSISHGLRWDAPHETVYPATFVLDRAGVVRFAHVSHEHGDRASANDILAALAAIGGPGGSSGGSAPAAGVGQ
jgi:peroxiredoxin